MIKIIQQNTSERIEEMKMKHAQFIQLYYNSELTVRGILKKLDVSMDSEAHKYIRTELRKEEISPHKRAQMIRFGKWLI